MTSIPDITRLLARIAEWQEGHGKPGGRTEAARRLDEAHELLDEVSNMLVEMRRELMAGGDPVTPRITMAGPFRHRGAVDGDRSPRSFASVATASAHRAKALRERRLVWRCRGGLTGASGGRDQAVASEVADLGPHLTPISPDVILSKVNGVGCRLAMVFFAARNSPQLFLGELPHVSHRVSLCLLIAS